MILKRNLHKRKLILRLMERLLIFLTTLARYIQGHPAIHDFPRESWQDLPPEPGVLYLSGQPS